MSIAKPLTKHTRLAEFIELRKMHGVTLEHTLEKLLSLNKTSTQDTKVVLFFCSSAGEYEQAIPVIERFKNQGWQPVILFFSTSGTNFAEKRSERTPYFLYPLDTLKHARTIFSALRPSLVFIVRQEIWPSFLWVSKKNCPLYLLNASVSESSKSAIQTYVKKVAYKAFDRIFVCTPSDESFFHQTLQVPREKLVLSGDTKYDRVLEAAKKIAEDKARFSDSPSELSPSSQASPSNRPCTVIIGSSWPDDVSACCSAAGAFVTSTKINLVVVPHDVSKASIQTTENLIQKAKLNIIKFSSLAVSKEAPIVDGEINLQLFFAENPGSVLLVDSVGQLSRLYKQCDIALVGGACHYQVHNVLEPACFGLTVTFGSLYKNSHEAVCMVEKGLVVPFRSHEDLRVWFNQQLSPGVEKRLSSQRRLMIDHVTSLAGASDKVMSSLSSFR